MNPSAFLQGRSWALWSGFGGGCQTNNDGDPVVVYDPIADRMMFRLAYRKFGDHQAWVTNHSITAGSSVGFAGTSCAPMRPAT